MWAHLAQHHPRLNRRKEGSNLLIRCTALKHISLLIEKIIGSLNMYRCIYIYCIATLAYTQQKLDAWSESVPFTYDRSNVHLHAANFADLNTHGTGRGSIPEAGSIEIHGGIFNTRTPGWGLPVEHHTRVFVADSPVLQGRSCRTRLPFWPPTHRKEPHCQRHEDNCIQLGILKKTE